MTSALAWKHDTVGHASTGLPLVVSLHARGGDAAAGLSLARRLFGAQVQLLAPQAARPCNPFQSDLRSTPSYAGFSWYLADRVEEPEAASFGDALSQLAGFVEEQRTARRALVVGEGQGAVLALALAALAPATVGAALAVGAGWPSLPGWEPRRLDLGGTRVALLALDGAAAARTRAHFEGLGASVSTLGDAGGAGDWLRAVPETSRNVSDAW